MAMSINVESSNGVTTRPVVQEKFAPEDFVGSWLCEKGPYQEYIEALSGSNPNLKKADPIHNDNPLKAGAARVVLLESSATGAADFAQKDFKNASDLRKHFEQTNDKHGRKRVYIMEGLAPDFVAILGGHFFMDPAFFQRQERSCPWSNEFTPASDALPQPSLLDPEKSFHLQYCELRQFNRSMENTAFFCRRTGRHVGMTPPRYLEESTTAILRRKVAWWSQAATSGGGWDVVILCDPQLAEINPVEKIKDQEKLVNTPFQGGYVDFVPLPDRKRAQTIPPHPHHSMLKDLCHYFNNHSYLMSAEEWETPLTSSIFLKKIVAVHYLQLIDYIKAMLPSLEVRLTSAWVEEQDQWKSLQTISRRCGNYSDDMEDALLSLGYSLDGFQTYDRVNWKDTRKDFQYIYFRLKVLKQRADNLLASMTGLASIAGNRQNLEEAKRVKRLNFLALFFIPLAYTSSLFSMQDSFAPGMGKFWVYWVSALGLVAFTVFLSWVLDSALDEAAQWSLPFQFWPNSGGDAKKQKRTSTAIWGPTK